MMNDGDNTDCLRPFAHQVTGRSHMLSLNSSTICKTLRPRELLFYKSMPKELLKFIPKYKGVLYAELQAPLSPHAEYDFKVDKVISSPVCNIEDGKDCKLPQNSSNSEFGIHDLYKSTLFKGLENFKYDMADGFSSHPWTIDKDAEAVVEYVGANPWAMRQHQKEINRMLSMNRDKQKEDEATAVVDTDGNYLDNSRPKLEYLLLEDVTEGFRHPNLIDFKLGRQMERLDRSLAKKNKHIDLVKMSTTGSLMLRLAGMQVYQIKTGHYLCRDKYYGSGLSSIGLKETIRQFLNNGESVLLDVISPIVEQLDELKVVLMKQNTFRFYATSLLILYEGASCDKCVDASKYGEKMTTCCCRPCKAVVKMVDFAHSTFQGFGCDLVSHEGPDMDCVNALGNLIEIFSTLQTAGERA